MYKNFCTSVWQYVHVHLVTMPDSIVFLLKLCNTVFGLFAEFMLGLFRLIAQCRSQCILHQPTSRFSTSFTLYLAGEED
jgi:hypothetical protein